MPAFEDKCPLMFSAPHQTDEDAKTLGCLSHAPFERRACFATRRRKLQDEMGQALSEHNRKALLASLSKDGRLAFSGAGGTGARNWLILRQEGDTAMPDGHERICLKRRLRAAVCMTGGLCQHKCADGSICSEALDPHG